LRLVSTIPLCTHNPDRSTYNYFSISVQFFSRMTSYFSLLVVVMCQQFKLVTGSSVSILAFAVAASCVLSLKVRVRVSILEASRTAIGQRVTVVGVTVCVYACIGNETAGRDVLLLDVQLTRCVVYSRRGLWYRLCHRRQTTTF